MLQQLFAKFDRDSTRFGLYKLCTIGDAYVAVSEPVTEDTPDYDPANGAERVLEMAHAMIENIRAVRERLKVSLLKPSYWLLLLAESGLINFILTFFNLDTCG